MADERLKLSPEQTLRVLGSTPEVLEIESTWTTVDQKPKTHWHPSQHEHFEVLEGQLTAELEDDAPTRLGVGESLDVPPRTRHRMWSDHTEPTRVAWRITPAQRTLEMFRRIDSGLNPLTQLGFLWRFRNEFRIGKPRGNH